MRGEEKNEKKRRAKIGKKSTFVAWVTCLWSLNKPGPGLPKNERESTR